MVNLVRHLYEFGEYQLDADKRLLLRKGEPVTIAPKVYEVLAALIERRGQVLTKDELLTRVWPDTVVEESNLTVSISALRKALGERRDEHRYIVTIPGSGYQFVAEVNEWRPVPGNEPALVIEKQTISRVIIEEEITGADKAGLVPGTPGMPGTLDRTAKMAAVASEPSSSRSLTNQLHQPSRSGFKLGTALALLSVAILGSGTGLYINFIADRSLPKSPVRVLPLTAYVGSEAEPAFSPDGKQIAFVWDGEQENNHDIYVKLLDVGHPLRLTTDPSRDRTPAWSPDGRFIAFLRHLPGGTDEAIAILVPSLGGPERKLGPVADGGVDWSPDGKSLAVIERGPPGQSEGIVLLSVETGERRRITKPLLHEEPRGRRHLAFDRRERRRKPDFGNERRENPSLLGSAGHRPLFHP